MFYIFDQFENDDNDCSNKLFCVAFFRIKFLKPYTFFEPFLSHCNETVITLACASPPSPVGVLFPVKAPKLTAFHPLCEVSKTRASILGQSSIKEWHPTLPLRQQVAKSEYSESLREVFDFFFPFPFPKDPYLTTEKSDTCLLYTSPSPRDA